jgi:hypothetical protein
VQVLRRVGRATGRTAELAKAIRGPVAYRVRVIIQRIAACAAALILCAGTAGVAGAQSTMSAPSSTTAPSMPVMPTKKGAIFDAKLLTELNSKTGKSGDSFQMTATSSFFHKHPELNGVILEGHLENVVAASPTHKASMNIIFDDFKYPDGHTVPVKVKPTKMSTFEPQTHHMRDLALIVGGAVAGHITSKKTGVKGGTAAGAAAGFALASTLKSDIDIKAGTIIQFKVLEDVPPEST